MIRLEQVSLRAGTFRLTDVSLEVPAGGYALVIGPTGCGKTSLLEAIAGHVPVTTGRIFLQDRDVTSVPPEARRIGFVYQAYHLFPHLSVRANISYGLKDDPAAGRRVEELATMLGIAPLLDRSPRGLSGGEQQRIALARALAPRPAVLLLDEPFAAVDPAMRRMLRRELQDIREREGVTILHVTHDVDDALRLGDLIAVLGNGRIAQAGPPEEVFRYPESAFVADFLGAGTVLKGTLTRTGEREKTTRRFPARFESGGLQLEVIAEREGGAYAVIRPEDVLVSRQPFPDYPRNRFAATVHRVERLGPVANVHLDASGQRLMAAITAATVDTLALRPGDAVSIAIKATAVHLI
ncbi:MAG TPA: ABC transporter ATP-binding protein [Gemmatimonadales bacterium]